ncbi:MAG: hypothetical protein PHG67_02010 [Bacteroidales bacterium]|nr:hypothetical protein [Bacteroidales bacterium]
MDSAPSSQAGKAYFVALVLMAMSVPLSKFTMSVFQFVLVIIWFLDGISSEVLKRFFRKSNPFGAILYTVTYIIRLAADNFIEKFKLFFKNRTALIVSSIFLLHIIGLIHTSDFNYALKDLRTKLPLFVLPLVMSTMPALSRKQLNQLLLFYVAAVFIGTLFSMNVFFKQEFNDIRTISIFISSIRFSLNILFAIFILGWFITIDRSFSWQWLSLMFLILLWFLAFLMILESGIGLVSLVLLLSLIAAYKAITIAGWEKRFVTLMLMILIPLGFTMYIIHEVKVLSTAKPVSFEQFDSHTAQGTPYVHDTISFGIEDGKYVGLYLAITEMEQAWNQRSNFDFNGQDKAGQYLKYTLIRYLTSKNLRKDAEGVNSLTIKDIKAVENGVANVNYLENPSIRTRISKMLLGYQNYANLDNPNGSSLMQRIEYIRASFHIIHNNLLFGVGTGDLPMHFERAYEEINSSLHAQWRWRSHNQYISILVGFGIFGLIWFLVSFGYPYFSNSSNRHFLYTIFLLIIMFSMVTEDTIENQAGVTLLAYFNSLFLFAASKTGLNTK